MHRNLGRTVTETQRKNWWLHIQWSRSFWSIFFLFLLVVEPTPSEKYDRQNGFIFPNFRGEHKKYLKPQPSFCFLLVLHNFTWKKNIPAKFIVTNTTNLDVSDLQQLTGRHLRNDKSRKPIRWGRSTSLCCWGSWPVWRWSWPCGIPIGPKLSYQRWYIKLSYQAERKKNRDFSSRAVNLWYSKVFDAPVDRYVYLHI